MKTYVGYWKSKDQIVLLHIGTLCNEVEFDLGIKYIQAELGPSDDFDIICELDTENDQMIPLSVRIKDFDNGQTDESMAMKIVVENLTSKMLGNKGATVLDVGNYIYRKFGLIYEMCPEYSNSGEAKNSLTFFVNKGSFSKQDHLIDFVSQKTGVSANLVRAGVARFNIEIKKAGSMT